MNLGHRLRAYQALMSNYRAAWTIHWRHRREQTPPGRLNALEAAFLPAALSLQERPVSPAARVLALVLISLVACTFAWSIIGRVDIVVNANGRIIPSARTKVIASVELASVREIHVVEGQAVRKGDVLLELDASAADAEYAKAIGELSAAGLAMARARALIDAVASARAPRMAPVSGVPALHWRAEQLHLEGQYRDFRARLRRIDDDIRRYTEVLPLALQRERDFVELAGRHDVAAHALLEKRQARIEIEAQLRDANNQRVALVAETTRLAYDTLAESARLAGAARQDADKAGVRSKLLTLVAPVDGTVQQLVAHTVGGVVPAAQQLMLIVPHEQYTEVEATIENKDIGFIREGQGAQVKIEAFDYTRHGTIAARVSHIARDAQQDDKRGLLYTVKVTLEHPYIDIDGARHPLNAGMAVNVEVKTGTRRVIGYVLSPILRHKRESLNER
jgi:hemolysin D